MVCLLTDAEIQMRYPDYVHWLQRHAAASPASAALPPAAATPAAAAVSPAPAAPHAIWLPVIDGEITNDEDVVDTVSQVVERLQDGHGVVVHCGAGMARTAVVCILAMVALGAESEVAAVEFRQARPGGGPDGPAQEKQIARLASRFS